MKVIELESATFRNLSSILGLEINGVRNYLLFIEYKIMAFKKNTVTRGSHQTLRIVMAIRIAFQLVQS